MADTITNQPQQPPAPEAPPPSAIQAALAAVDSALGEGEVIRYSPKQQAHLDTIIRAAQGKAASGVRAERDQALKEIERLKSLAPPSPEEAAEFEERVSKAKGELEAVQSAARAARLEAALADAATKAAFISQSVGMDLLRSHVGYSEGELRVLNQNGSPMINPANGEPLTVAEYAQQVANQNPYLIRGDVRSGAGSFESKTIAPTEPQLSEIFGRKSNSAKANALAMKSPKTYSQMRERARAQGLI